MVLGGVASTEPPLNEAENRPRPRGRQGGRAASTEPPLNEAENQIRRARSTRARGGFNGAASERGGERRPGSDPRRDPPASTEPPLNEAENCSSPVSDFGAQ